MHVIEDVMNYASKEVSILNSAIGEYSCVVFHHDAALSKEEEYTEASQKVEIYHGSGIIVDERFVVTNMYVIEDVMNDASKEVSIFNAAIGECPCIVFHHDARKDLALLCFIERGKVSSCHSVLGKEVS